MKRTTLLIIVLYCTIFTAKAQWPEQVILLQTKPGESITATGDLANGSVMADLSWASNSSNACFPGTQNQKFRGNHVLYATTMPPKSILTVSVSPDDDKGNLSLYGYMMSSTEFRVVPDLPRCITCEADHKWDRPKKGKTQTSMRLIEFQNPTGHTYNIVIGVSAPQGVVSGAYNLKLSLVQ